MSRSSRARGLKYYKVEEIAWRAKSRSSRARGLKFIALLIIIVGVECRALHERVD